MCSLSIRRRISKRKTSQRPLHLKVSVLAITKPFISHRELLFKIWVLILMWHFCLYHYAMIKKLPRLSVILSSLESLLWTDLDLNFKKFNWIDFKNKYVVLCKLISYYNKKNNKQELLYSCRCCRHHGQLSMIRDWDFLFKTVIVINLLFRLLHVYVHACAM